MPPTPRRQKLGNTIEHDRLNAANDGTAAWRRWGPFVSARAWGTVREDYSADGDVWDFTTHEIARFKAFRWGEDAIAGLCDDLQIVVLAPAFWNGKDPILKERFYGLTPREGNHGEDVKEAYFYLDNTPSHSYMKFLYKYPQAEFPYDELLQENRKLGRLDHEYELSDTGVFDDLRYFDIVVEYAKFGPEDIVMRIEAFNRGPDAAPLHIVPQLWFRNRWAWSGLAETKPAITLGDATDDFCTLIADDAGTRQVRGVDRPSHVGRRYLCAEPPQEILFTDNETNGPRVFGSDTPSLSHFTKDAFHHHIAHGELDRVNPEPRGTKAGIHYRFDVPSGESVVVRARFSDTEHTAPLDAIDELIAQRKDEADNFYATIHPEGATDEERLIQRQAFAGMLWCKQFYLYDVNRWLQGDNPAHPPPESRLNIRNTHWRHLYATNVLSMPDDWEYPWFAAWDLAFHAVVLALVDLELAKEQMWLMLSAQYQHPNGQLPAYEWEFSDTNPPVHAWAVWRIYNMDAIRTGKADRQFLERCFHKMLINFTWWVNKVDRDGSNIFEGGFLGLDNITVFDRSEPLTDGSILEQGDSTGWMGMYCLNMMRMALELALDNPVYEDLAVKFFEHFVYIGAAMKQMGRSGKSLWDPDDGFFYDLLTHPDGNADYFRVRSLVGLIPLYAIERLDEDVMAPCTKFCASFSWFLENRRELANECVTTITDPDSGHQVHILTIVNQEQLQRIIARLWNAEEFLSPHGLRSLSKAHATDPFLFNGLEVAYEPGESVSMLKGGNSNWRGPIWFPTTFMMIEAMRKIGAAYGHAGATGIKHDDGSPLTYREIAEGFAERLIGIYRADESGYRPFMGDTHAFTTDPYWRDLLWFYEYFHGETGAGLGASHQTGWTGLVASIIDEWE